jgi:hypothetical protein
MAEPRAKRRACRGTTGRPACCRPGVRRYRAQRHAKVEHRRATRAARLRFWAFFGLLLLACLVVAVTVWSEIRSIFGI